MNEPGVELVSRCFPFGRHLHVTDHHATVHAGIQRTQAVGEFLRQHRNDAAREIHARRTFLRFIVKRRPFRHIVTHVGNRDQKPPSARSLCLRPHGVIKVPGILTVDRHEGHVSQIDAAVGLIGIRHIGQGRGFRHDGFREHVRQRKFCERHLKLRRRFVRRSQHLCDRPHCRQRVKMRRGGDLHRNERSCRYVFHRFIKHHPRFKPGMIHGRRFTVLSEAAHDRPFLGGHQCHKFCPIRSPLQQKQFRAGQKIGKNVIPTVGDFPTDTVGRFRRQHGRIRSEARLRDVGETYLQFKRIPFEANSP